MPEFVRNRGINDTRQQSLTLILAHWKQKTEFFFFETRSTVVIALVTGNHQYANLDSNLWTRDREVPAQARETGNRSRATAAVSVKHVDLLELGQRPRQAARVT